MRRTDINKSNAISAARLGFLLSFFFALFALSPLLHAAEQRTPADIAAALVIPEAPRSRGLSPGGDAGRGAAVQDPLVRAAKASVAGKIERRSRGLNLSPDRPQAETRVNDELQAAREEVAKVAEASPHTDIEVNFEKGSANLTPEARAALNTLGTALLDPRLRGNTFIISGHTDTTGTADFNMKLSIRRARAVNDFLVDSFRLDRKNLIPLGYGFERLKDRADGTAAVNRRVEVSNVAELASGK